MKSRVNMARRALDAARWSAEAGGSALLTGSGTVSASGRPAGTMIEEVSGRSSLRPLLLTVQRGSTVWLPLCGGKLAAVGAGERDGRDRAEQQAQRKRAEPDAADVQYQRRADREHERYRHRYRDRSRAG